MIAALEAGIIFLLVVTLIQGVLRVGPEPTAIFLVLSAVGLIIAHLMSFHFRWQMAPAYFVTAILLIVLLFGVQFGSIIKFVSIGVAALLLVLSFALSIGFPVRSLPVPEGPHMVGLVDLDRDYVIKSQVVGDSAGGRRLHLKIWYPATIEDQRKYTRETLWSEFHNPDQFSKVERVFTTYLKNIKTHSFKTAPIAPDPSQRSVLIYNHAGLSTATENTLLMEFLASHGYVIVGVRHEGQRDEYTSLQASLSDEKKAKELEELKKMSADMDRKSRAAVALQAYQSNITLTTIVKRRALDTAYVLDNLASILNTIPGCQNGICVNEDKIGLVGFSLGGAVATELCKSDQRCRAAVNLDGGIFGTNIQAPVTVPYLMLYSEPHEGGNDFAKKASGPSFEEHTIEGAMHANFHDATLVLPALRWFGLLGPIDGREMIRRKNTIVLKFLNDNL